MKKFNILVVLAALAIAFAMTCLFQVRQWEQALVLRFGEAVRVENQFGDEPDAGLKLKLPWDKVITMDRRNLVMDLHSQELPAADQELLIVDAFVRYRIVDVIKFYETLRNEKGAQNKLESIMDSTLRDVLSSVNSEEIISGHRAELMDDIQTAANGAARLYGLEIIDVRIKRADLPQENAQRVFARMITERQQAAALTRANGEKRARQIRATADKTVTVTLANAQQESEILQGQGDAQRNAIYAKVHSADPEFYAFFRSMEAYKKGLTTGTTYVMSPDNDFLSYMNNKSGKSRR